jgi:outer membrane receptor protein involved in Fe transport
MMLKKEIPLMQKTLFVLMLLLIFAPNIRLSAQPAGSPSNPQQDANKPKDVFEIPLEKLMEIEVVSSATLTETKPRLVPAAVTTITAEQIRSSGARSLFELLDIYVPNLQWSRHHWENDQMGLRGIINDRDDKYLLLVNGRSMNDRTHLGAVTEQDQVLLSDIHHIDVVRGPGSALYGPGAVSMVINIITYSSDTFQGTEVTSRLGAIEEFYTGELKYGRKNDANDGGIFVYSGFGKYVGASKYDAPQIYPMYFPTTGGTAPVGVVPGEGTQAGEPMTNTFVNRDGAQALPALPMKLHVQLKKDNWDLWARLTRGGKQYSWAIQGIARTPYGTGDTTWWSTTTWPNTYPSVTRPNFYTYLQFTGYAGYKQELTETIDLDAAFSYQSTTLVEERASKAAFNYRYDNYYAKILLNWQPNEHHKVAIGGEYLLNDLGRSPWNGLGYTPPKLVTPLPVPSAQEWGWGASPMPKWHTQMYSLLGEWQWTINDKWTVFVGGRIDDHTYVAKMFSPRAALVYTPNDRDTYKLMFSRSARTNFEAEMGRNWERLHRNSDPEKLTSGEFRYERKCSSNLDFATSVYHHKLDVISWGSSKTSPAGTQEDWGIEGELSYHTEKTRFTLSHGYTKLLSFKLIPGKATSITSMPYNYGDDLTNWSNHNTKAVYQRKLDDKWTFDASLRVYWGFQGLKDYDEYRPYAGNTPTTYVTRAWERTYRGSYFLDLGLEYKYSKNLEINLTGYNLLGIFNKDFNKRNYIETGGTGVDFRSAAPAVGVSLTYTF